MAITGSSLHDIPGDKARSTGWTHLGYRADIAEKRRRDLARKKGRPRKIVGELESHVRDRLKTLYLQLRHGHRRRKKRFSVPRVRTELLYRKSIEERSKVISERRRIGDWERDLMFGDSRKAALLTFVERRTGFVLLRRVSSKSPYEIASKTIEALRQIRARQLCKSLTNDNGFEFREHRQESRVLGIPIYFTHPYSSWERGTNENANGLIRQYFPKQSPIEEFADEKAQMVQARLSTRPRKKLGFRTPLEVFQSDRFAVIS